jgi:hypothetical protein
MHLRDFCLWGFSYEEKQVALGFAGCGREISVKF